MTVEKHRLQLMGAFAAAAPLSRKARALLAYLALNADAAVPRERLSGLLWSERAEEQARGSLRQCLQELRPFASGPSPLIDIGRVEITLWSGRAVTDLDEIRAMAGAGDASGLADRLSGVTNRLLANLDGLDPAFDEWLSVRRAAIDNQIMAEAMACASAVLAARPRDSLRLAQAICAREPLDEAAARLAMIAAHAAGEQGEVRRQWRRLEEDLKRELGAQPSPETAACFAALQGAPAPAPTPTGRSEQPSASRPDPAAGPAFQAPLRRGRWLMLGSAFGVALAALLAWLWLGHPSGGPGSIRVERLQSPAGDAQAGLFADGLAGDLAMMPQGRRSDLRIFEPGIGTSPRFIVDGHVRSVAGKLNAVLELHLASDGSIVWSTNLQQPMAATVDMRRQAALKLASVLTCTVGDDDQEFKDIEALKLFLAACEGIAYGTDAPDGSGSVRDLFRKVVERAPNFARAWAEVAVGDAIHTPSPSESPDTFAAVRRLTEQDAAHALALDPRQARAWVARSMVRPSLGDWFESEADLSRALALDPYEPLALTEHGKNLGQIGRYNDLLAVQRRLINSDPLTLTNWGDLAQVEGYAGDLSAARATLDQAEKRWPNQAEIGKDRLYLEARIGDPATAKRLLDDPAGRTPLDPAVSEYLRLMIGARADRKRADEAAAYMLAHLNNGLELRDVVQGLVDVGRVDQALDLAEAHIADFRRQRTDLDAMFRPYMANFLASPRFMPLAARIGLVDIWRRTGLWPDFCTAHDAPYGCKAVAAQALAKN